MSADADLREALVWLANLRDDAPMQSMTREHASTLLDALDRLAAAEARGDFYGDGAVAIEGLKRQLAATESRATAAEAQRDTLAAYIIYTPCHMCGLTNPNRVAAACPQCAKARIALAAVEPKGDEHLARAIAAEAQRDTLAALARQAAQALPVCDLRVMLLDAAYAAVAPTEAGK